MKENLDFLIKIEKLKEMPRTGWILLQVENPETIAEHTFRMTFLVWLLAKKKNLNVDRAIKFAFFHDFCEVYAGDLTPFSYYISLPRDGETKEKLLKRWVRLTKKEKEIKGKEKYQIEKSCLLKLVNNLDPKFKKEIFSSWLNYEKGISAEGRFAKQVDRIEVLIQSIEYFGTKSEKGGTSWWEGTEEMVHDPLLLEFLKVIQKKFYHPSFKPPKKSKELENILDFILKIGNLKKIPRTSWVLRKVKNPETMAGHIFTVTLMTWIFNKTIPSHLNEEKLLKMALCHQLCEVYAGDETTYTKILEREKGKKREDILKKWFRLSKKEKSEIFLEDYRKEKKALEKLTSKLEKPLRKEIIQLWEEYKTSSSAEGRFLQQIDVLAVLLQACQYWQKDKKFPIEAFWEWAFESSDNPINFEFMEELKKKFYNKKFPFNFSLNFFPFNYFKKS